MFSLKSGDYLCDLQEAAPALAGAKSLSLSLRYQQAQCFPKQSKIRKMKFIVNATSPDRPMAPISGPFLF